MDLLKSVPNLLLTPSLLYDGTVAPPSGSSVVLHLVYKYTQLQNIKTFHQHLRTAGTLIGSCF